MLRERYGLRGVQAERAAALVVSHWRLETACGRYEYGHALGALHCTGYRTCTRVGSEELRVYVSTIEACRDYLRLVSEHYPRAWEALRAGSERYLEVLASAGYIAPGVGRDRALASWERVLVSTLGRLGIRPWWVTSVPWRPVPARARPRSRGGGIALVGAAIAGLVLLTRR